MKTLTAICFLSFLSMPNVCLAFENLTFVEKKVTTEQVCAQGQNGTLRCKKVISETNIFTDNEGNVFEFQSNATHHFSVEDRDEEPEKLESSPQLENAV